MRDDDWVTLPLTEYEHLRGRVSRAERFLRDHPTLAQEFEELRRRLEVAEALRDTALAEAARLRAASVERPDSISALTQVRFVGQLLDVLFERFTPVGADVRLQRCRICDLTSVEQAVPSLLDHYHFCPARLVLHEWRQLSGSIDA